MAKLSVDTFSETENRAYKNACQSEKVRDTRVLFSAMAIINKHKNNNNMKTIITTLGIATTLMAGNVSAALLFSETFDDDSQFTTSEGFFSDGTGDFFGIAGPSEDWGAGATPSVIKGYTGFTGNFLTGMDLDGEGASLPITVTWSGIDIAGQTGLVFSGDFAEFFDDPGDIDALDQLYVEAQIDGGGFSTILEFIPGSFSSGSGDFNGFFELGGDTLGSAAQNFEAAIAGTGATLDIRLVVSVNSGDEDFGVDNFQVNSVPEPSSLALFGLASMATLLRRRR